LFLRTGYNSTAPSAESRGIFADAGQAAIGE
jgi:hypothetical protein